MRKAAILCAFAFTALLPSSCQKEPVAFGENAELIERFTTPAGASTRMSLEYTCDDTGWEITKTWHEGDSLIGFVTTGTEPVEYKYFTYRCTGIEGGLATWTRVPESSSASYPRSGISTTLNMAYAPGVSAEGFAKNGTLSIKEAAGAIACGSGQYDASTGKLDIVFSNQSAMLCLITPTLSGVSVQTAIDHIEARGIYTEGTLELNEGKLELTCDELSLGVTSHYPAAGESWGTDTSGKLEKNIFIPIIPGSDLSQMSLKVVTKSGHCYFYNITKSATMSATAYRIDRKSFVEVEAEYVIGEGAPKTAATVQEAFAAANSAEEDVAITLQKDITLTDSLEFTNTEVALTLDLNGKSITAGNKSTMHPALMMNTDGCVVNIFDGSAGGDGKIDQKYGGTGNTIVVKAGTLNILGGTICNSSGTGYGRVALNIGSGTASAAVNISGGYVYGGRTIYLGPGQSDAPATLNMTGGKIEGKYSSTSGKDIYASIYVNNHCRATITGGSILSNKAPCIYVRNEMEDIEVVLGSRDGINAPYLYTSGHTQCINAGDEDKYKEAAYKKYKLFKCYWNKNVLEYPDQTDASVSALSPAVVYDGKSYGYLVKASSSGNTQPVQDGDTSDWF